MFNFEITISIDGKQFKVNVPAKNQGDALAIVKAQYASCEIRNVLNKGYIK